MLAMTHLFKADGGGCIKRVLGRGRSAIAVVTSRAFNIKSMTHQFIKWKIEMSEYQSMENALKWCPILIVCRVKKTGAIIAARIYRWHETNEDDGYDYKGWSEGGDYYGTMWMSKIYEPIAWCEIPKYKGQI